MKIRDFIPDFDWFFRRGPIGPTGGGDKDANELFVIECWCPRWVDKSTARIGGIL